MFQCLCITLHVTLCIAKTQKVEYVKSIEVKSEKEQKISKIYQFEHVVIGKQAAAASVRHYYCCWIEVSEYQNSQNKTKQSVLGTHVVQSSKQIFFFLCVLRFTWYLSRFEYNTQAYASRKCVFIYFLLFFSSHTSH